MEPAFHSRVGKQGQHHHPVDDAPYPGQARCAGVFSRHQCLLLPPATLQIRTAAQTPKAVIAKAKAGKAKTGKAKGDE
jgi:hypothetical protein